MHLGGHCPLGNRVWDVSSAVCTDRGDIGWSFSLGFHHGMCAATEASGSGL